MHEIGSPGFGRASSHGPDLQSSVWELTDGIRMLRVTLPGFDVHHLGGPEAGFSIDRRFVSDRRMHTSVVVETFDPIDDVQLGHTPL